MRKISHIVYIQMLGLGLIEWRGQTWFDYRADLFRKFVIPSLANQTTKDFTIWISFTPETKENPAIKRIEKDLKEAHLKYILTFDGIMMHDDRGTWHNDDLEQRMSASLAYLKENLLESEWVYKTDLGSDDMFSREALEEIQKEEPRERGATYYLNGYILNMNTGQVAEWNRTSSCSKYTIMYPNEIFFDAKKHLEYVKGLVSHETIPLIFDASRLPDGRYMCGVHSGNISTTWNNSFRGKELLGDLKYNIKKDFGLC